MEVFVPSSLTSCSLPSLPVKVDRHSQEGLTQCGGRNSLQQCHSFSFSSGRWTRSHTLASQRLYLASWSTQGRIVLMGGLERGRSTSTEILEDNISQSGFQLQDHTK